MYLVLYDKTYIIPRVLTGKVYILKLSENILWNCRMQ